MRLLFSAINELSALGAVVKFSLSAAERVSVS